MLEKTMGRKRLRDSELMVRKDQFLELPDEIVSTIISMLPLREAVRTSVLSKRWRSLWICQYHLKFDFNNVLWSRAHLRKVREFQSKRQIQRRKFVERVDKIMCQRCMGLNINSLTIHFHLGKEFSSHIDRWISWGVMKGVEMIDLDLSENSSFRKNVVTSNGFEHYEFHSSILEPSTGGKCNLMHLRLDSCTFTEPLSSNNLNSLITLELKSVWIEDEMLNDLLSNCLILEKMNLHLCQHLVKLKISEGSRQLKFLNIKDCLRLKDVEISSQNLKRLEYTGPVLSFSFKCVHKLTEVYLSFTQNNRIGGVIYAFTKLAMDLPNLEKLNLISILSMKALELPANGRAFTNVKQLFLTIYPFDDEDKLSWIVYILRAFPQLVKLQLNLFSPSFIKQGKKIERLLPGCPHNYLTELEINGFYGNRHEVELLTYLLENTISLRILVVRARQKVFKGFNNWDYEEASSFYISRMKRISDWLHHIIPESILLEVQ